MRRGGEPIRERPVPPRAVKYLLQEIDPPSAQSGSQRWVELPHVDSCDFLGAHCQERVFIAKQLVPQSSGAIDAQGIQEDAAKLTGVFGRRIGPESLEEPQHRPPQHSRDR